MYVCMYVSLNRWVATLSTGKGSQGSLVCVCVSVYTQLAWLKLEIIKWPKTANWRSQWLWNGYVFTNNNSSSKQQQLHTYIHTTQRNLLHKSHDQRPFSKKFAARHVFYTHTYTRAHGERETRTHAQANAKEWRAGEGWQLLVLHSCEYAYVCVHVCAYAYTQRIL